MSIIDTQSSRNISSIDYDPEAKALTVTFRSGATYIYEAVEETDYINLLSAPSRTGYLRHILGVDHKFTKL